MPKILKILELEKTYTSGSKKITVLHDISFEIEKGDTFSIVGPSGSGKTTLSRCILQLMPHSGKTIFHDNVLEECLPKYLKNIRKKIQIISVILIDQIYLSYDDKMLLSHCEINRSYLAG